MDDKTKRLVDEVDAMYADRDTAVLAKIPELIAAIREQDKRARHAEQERDAYDARITELEAENKKLKDAIVVFTDMFASGPLEYTRVAAGSIALRRLVG